MLFIISEETNKVLNMLVLVYLERPPLLNLQQVSVVLDEKPKHYVQRFEQPQGKVYKLFLPYSY